MAAACVKLAALFVVCRPCPARMNRAGSAHGRPPHIHPGSSRFCAVVRRWSTTRRCTYDPMQQARSDHFVLAKLRRDVLKQGIAVGLRYGFGGLHQPVEIVSGQSQLVQGGHGKLRSKTRHSSDRRATKWLIASWTAPPDPRCPSRILAASPPTLPNPNLVGTPGGVFLLFGPLPATVLGFVSPKFSGRGIGARQPRCRALRRSPTLTSQTAVGTRRVAVPLQLLGGRQRTELPADAN